MNTVTWDGVRSQIAARKTVQLEALVQEVPKQVEGALDEINGKNRLVGVLDAKTNCLHVTKHFFCFSRVVENGVCGWCSVNAGKVAKPLLPKLRCARAARQDMTACPRAGTGESGVLVS